ncbi:replication initiator [Streptomyces jumonjinensis]|uniref:replication initiator n=1 Tax=Streptomyces jumonjinensis TaxID=1945 RepID=UPI002B212A69|nr:replication initiator [Streptomyces jumonjinensis]
MTTPDNTTPAGRRAELDRSARLRHLTEADRDTIRLVRDPKFSRWLEQVTATGGCSHPIHLGGTTITRNAATGEILHHYSTRDEPGERLLVRCGNRRATVCAPCSGLHAGDTYHLVRAGLTGGKTVPASVRHRPRLFVTLTATSFGRVHRATDSAPCRPRRDPGTCEHGRPLGCAARHTRTDPRAGQPLCADCYDYPAHVLWHAHAGQLWDRFTRGVRRHLAASAGIPRARFHDHARLSFAKIAEYQRRAAVHVHAVVRLDGPGGPHDHPPAWGTADTLTEAVRTAARLVSVRAPYSLAVGERTLRWGSQLDVRTVTNADGGTSDDAVAAYIAKYVTKGAQDAGSGVDHPIRHRADIDAVTSTDHARTLMYTCWRLGALPEYAPLRLRAWTHTLGYRGHILTKSRAYSTTYAALRAGRADHLGHSAPIDALTERHWRYLGSGHTPGAALIAAGIADDVAANRRALTDGIGYALGSR